MDSHDEYRRRIVHRVFTGVHTDDTDLVSDALGEFEVACFKRGYEIGWRRGFLIGAFLFTLATLLLWARVQGSPNLMPVSTSENGLHKDMRDVPLKPSWM